MKDIQNTKSELLKIEDMRRLATVVMDSNDAIILHDFEGKILTWNYGAQEIYGYTEAEALEMNVNTIVAKSDREVALKLMQRIKKGEKVKSFELKRTTKDGRTLDVWLKITLLKDEKGKPNAIATTERDISDRKQMEKDLNKHRNHLDELVKVRTEKLELEITERKQAENKLRETNAKHFAMIENIGDVIAIVGVDGITKYQSPNVEKWFGWKPEDLIGTNGWDKMHPEDIERIQIEFSKILKKETATLVEYRFICKDGNYKWIELTAINRINEPAINGVLLNYHDITERKQAEESHRLHSEMLANIADGVYLVRLDDGIIAYTNPRFEEMFGYDKDEMIGKHASIVNAPTDKNPVETATEIINIIRETGGWQGEINNIKKDGTPFWCSANVSLFDHSKYGKVLVTVHSDITERKIAEELMKLSESRFRELVNTINSGVAIYKVINDGKTGSDYIIEDFNEFALQHENKLKEDIIGKSLKDLRPNIDDFGLIEVFRKVWKSGKPEFFPAKVYIDESFTNYYENRVFKLPSGEIVAVYDDVTEKKNIDIQLKESEERYNLAMNATQDGIFDWNLITNNIYYSPGWKRMLGYKDDELPNDFSIWENLVDEKDAEKSWKMQQELINKQRDRFELEFKMKHKEGHWVDILSRAEAFFDKKGKAIRIVGTHVDISERKKVEMALQESKVFNETLLNTSPDIIYIYDIVENKNVYSNDGIMKILGYSTEEIKDMGSQIIPQLMYPDDFKKYLKEIYPQYQQLRDNEFITHEFRMKHKSGDWHWLLSKESIFLRDTAGIPIQVFGIISDITESKNNIEELERRNIYIESIMENMPIGFAVNTVNDGKIKYMNKLFEEIYGWSRDILTNTNTLFDKVFPDSEYHKKMKLQIFADMQSGEYKRMNWKDLKITTSSGEERYVTVHNIPLIDQNIMISTVQDTTKRKLAEKEISKYHEHLEEIVKERTNNLEEKNIQLERFNSLFVDREFRIKELREKVKRLEEQMNK